MVGYKNSGLAFVNAIKKAAANINNKGKKKKKTTKQSGSALANAAKNRPKKQNGIKSTKSGLTNNASHIATVGKKKPTYFGNPANESYQKNKAKLSLESQGELQGKTLAAKRKKEAKEIPNVFQLQNKYGEFKLKDYPKYLEKYRNEKLGQAQRIEQAQKSKQEQKAQKQRAYTISMPKSSSQEEQIQEHLKEWKRQKKDSVFANTGNNNGKEWKKTYQEKQYWKNPGSQSVAGHALADIGNAIADTFNDNKNKGWKKTYQEKPYWKEPGSQSDAGHFVSWASKGLANAITSDEDVDYLNTSRHGPRQIVEKHPGNTAKNAKINDMSLEEVKNEMLYNYDDYNDKGKEALNNRYIILASSEEQVQNNTTSDPNALSDIEKSIYQENQKSQQNAQEGKPDWNNYVSDASIAMEELKQKGIEGADEAKAELQLNDEYNIFKKNHPDMADDQIYAYLATRDDYGKTFTELAQSKVKNQTVINVLNYNGGDVAATFNDIATAINSNPDGPTEETQQLRSDTWEWASERAQELKSQGKEQEASELMNQARIFYDNTATTSKIGKPVQAFSSGLESTIAGTLLPIGGVLGVSDEKMAEAEDAVRNAQMRQAVSKLGVGTIGKVGLDVMNVAGMQVPSLVAAGLGGGVTGALARTAEAGGMGLMALGAGGQQYVRAIDEGATEGQAIATGIVTGFLEGALFKLPMSAIVTKTPSQLKAEVVNALRNNNFTQYAMRHVGRVMGYEAIEEGTTAFIEEAVNEAVYSDHIQEMGFGEWLKQTGKQAAYEGFIGGLFGLGAGAVTARQNYNKDMYYYQKSLADTLKTKGAKGSATGAEANADTPSDGKFTTEGVSDLTGEYLEGAEQIADDVNTNKRQHDAAKIAEIGKDIAAGNLILANANNPMGLLNQKAATSVVADNSTTSNTQQAGKANATGNNSLQSLTLEELNNELKNAKAKGDTNLEAAIRNEYHSRMVDKVSQQDTNVQENVIPQTVEEAQNIGKTATENVVSQKLDSNIWEPKNSTEVVEELKQQADNIVSNPTISVERGMKETPKSETPTDVENDALANNEVSSQNVVEDNEDNKPVKNVKVETNNRVENNKVVDNPQNVEKPEKSKSKTKVNEKEQQPEKPQRDADTNDVSEHTKDYADFAENGISHSNSLTNKILEVAYKRASKNKKGANSLKLGEKDLATLSDRAIMEINPKDIAEEAKEYYTKKQIEIYNKRRERMESNGMYGISGWFEKNELNRLLDNDLSKIDVKAEKNGYIKADVYYNKVGLKGKALRTALQSIVKEGTETKPINTNKWHDDLVSYNTADYGHSSYKVPAPNDLMSELMELSAIYHSGEPMFYKEAYSFAKRLRSLKENGYGSNKNPQDSFLSFVEQHEIPYITKGKNNINLKKTADAILKKNRQSAASTDIHKRQKPKFEESKFFVVNRSEALDYTPTLDELAQIYASGKGMSSEEANVLAHKMGYLRKTSLEEFDNFVKQYSLPYFLKDNEVDPYRTFHAIFENSTDDVSDSATKITKSKFQEVELTPQEKQQQEQLLQKCTDMFGLDTKNYQKKYNSDKDQALNKILSKIHELKNDFGGLSLGQAVYDNTKRPYKSKVYKDQEQYQDIWSILSDNGLVPRTVPEIKDGSTEQAEYLKTHSLSELAENNDMADSIKGLSERILKEYNETYGVLKNNQNWLSSLKKFAERSKDKEVLLNFLENDEYKMLQSPKDAKAKNGDIVIDLKKTLAKVETRLDFAEKLSMKQTANECRAIIRFLKSHIEETTPLRPREEKEARDLINAEIQRGFDDRTYDVNEEKLKRWYQDESYSTQTETTESLYESFKDQPMEVIQLTPKQYKEYLHDYEGLLFTIGGNDISTVTGKLPFWFVEPVEVREGENGQLNVKWEPYEPITYGEEKNLAMPTFIALPSKLAKELEFMMENETQNAKGTWKQKRDYEKLQAVTWFDPLVAEKGDYANLTKGVPVLNYDSVKQFAKENNVPLTEMADNEELMISYLKQKLGKTKHDINVIKNAVGDDKITYNSIEKVHESETGIDEALTFDNLKKIYAQNVNQDLFLDFENDEKFIDEMEANPEVVKDVVAVLIADTGIDLHTAKEMVSKMEQNKIDEVFKNGTQSLMTAPDRKMQYFADVKADSKVNDSGMDLDKNDPEAINELMNDRYLDEADGVTERYRIIDKSKVGEARKITEAEREYLKIFKHLAKARGGNVRIGKNYTDNYSRILMHRDGSFDILISPNASYADLFKEAVREEYFHSFENSPEYNDIKNLILKAAKEKGIDTDAKLKELEGVYSNPDNGLTSKQYEAVDMDKELIAHLAAEMDIFDDAFLGRMQKTRPTLLERLGELLDRLFRRSNLDSQKRIILEIQDKLVKAQRRESNGHRSPYKIVMDEKRNARLQENKVNFKKHYNGTEEEGRRTYEQEITYLKDLDNKNVALHDIEAMHFMLTNLDAQIKKALGDKKSIKDVEDAAAVNSYDEATSNMSAIIEKMQELGIEDHNIISSLSENAIIRITEEGYEAIYNSLPHSIKVKYPNGIHLGQAELDAITECMNILTEKGNVRRTELERERAVAKMQTVLGEKIPKTTGKKLQAFQRNNLLLNPKTLIVRNLLSNLGAAAVNVPGDMVASIVDGMVSKKYNTQRTTGASMNGYLKAGIGGAKEVIENHKLGIDQNVAQANKWIEDVGKNPKTTLTIGRGNAFSNETFFGRFMNGANRFVGTALQTGDAFFSSAERHKYEYNLKQVAENKNQLNYWDEKTADYIAKKRTWQNTNKVTQACHAAVRCLNGGKDFGIGSIIAPFIKTPVNLAIATIEYSPIGLVKTLAIDAKNFKLAMEEGGNVELYQKKFVDGFGKAAMGTVLSLLALALYSVGALSGAEDDDYEVANFKKNVMGIQPYSIKIGGKSYTYDWAMPIGGNTMLTTNLLENWKKSASPSEFLSISTLVDMMISGVDVTGSFISDQTFFSTLSELSSKDTPTDMFIALGKNAVSQMLPFSSLFSQIAGLVDPYARRTTGKDVAEAGDNQTLTNIKNVAMSKYPGLSKELQPQLDAFGREQDRYSSDNFLMNVLQSFIAPGKSKNITQDDVAMEINRLYSETEDSGLIPELLDHKIQFNDQTVELNAREYTNYQKNYGDVAYNAIKKIINSDYYKNADDETRVSMIDMAYKLASDKAKYYTLKGKGMETNEFAGWEKEVIQGKAIDEVAYVKAVFGEYKENGAELIKVATDYGIEPKTYSDNLTALNSLQSDHYDDTGKESRTPHPELGKYPKWYKVASEIDKMDVSDEVKNVYFKSIYPKSSRTSGRYKAKKYFSWVSLN